MTDPRRWASLIGWSITAGLFLAVVVLLLRGNYE